MTEQANQEQANQTTGTGAKSVVLAGDRGGIIGIKAGMTQVYDAEGTCIPVTVIDIQSPNVVTMVRNEDRDGYKAVQIGFKARKAQNCTRADKGHFKKSGLPGYQVVTEFRVPSTDGVVEGATLSVDFVNVGDTVDVTATSKGKGFQGVMKRYNFAGSPKSHGHSVSHRAPGSIGNRADPGRVFPGKKMAGHMGARRVTVQNLEVVAVDKENSFILVRGAVPGPKNGVVRVLKAVKATAQGK